MFLTNGFNYSVFKDYSKYKLTKNAFTTHYQFQFVFSDITLQPPVEDGLETYSGTSGFDTTLSAYEELYITEVDSLKDINDCKPWSNLMENETLCLNGTVDFSKALKDYSKAVHIKMVDGCNQTTFSK
uniref:Uncharacterized protein n=1 Tax=Biomphalaria glabrata TaxID=6526 RepID=A0A2C9LQS6_BIOGL